MVGKVKRIFEILMALFILTVFVGTLFFSLFHVTHGMNMTGMSNCPFMPHQETICPMNLFDHISAWKAMYISIVSSSIFVSTVLLLSSIAPNLLFGFPVLRSTFIKRRLREQTYGYSLRFWQELFSAGVLHPKLY